LEDAPPLLPAQVQLHGPVPATCEATPEMQRLVVGALKASAPLARPQKPLTIRMSLQEAGEPPLLPAQVQFHGPVPPTCEGAPALHRLVVGALKASAPLAGPQEPLTVRMSLQEAGEPPLLPAHVQFHGPSPPTCEAAPTLHKPVVGALKASAPLAGPQEPLTVRRSLQEAGEPPLLPAHVQFHGPTPPTCEAAPALHKPVVGALDASAPLAGPQEPLISRMSVQLEDEPPLLPAQVQFHGPVPATLEGAPTLHRLVVGALKASAPLAGPQEPLTVKRSLQEASEPPLLPAQVQFHGPTPPTWEAVPALHRFVVGALEASVSLAGPQEPLTITRSLQEVDDPPLLPAQVQFHGPVPATCEAVPEIQRPVVGALKAPAPLARPQNPLTVRKSLQEAAKPPLLPAQVQVHGPVPATCEAVPEIQRPVVGALNASTPLARPQKPLTVNSSLQEASEPPLLPEQVQFHGPVPATCEGIPALHRLVVGALKASAPLDGPQAPLISRVSLQEAAAPPLLPAQVQFHGPSPPTCEAVPELHRLVVGALKASASLAEPQEPLMTGKALQDAVAPPFLPAQDQFHGPVPVTEEGAPAPQR